MPITFNYNKLKALVTFKKPLSQVTLSELADEASLFTSIPKHELKLIFAGGTLKNMGASLASYGIQESSKILILSSKPPPLSNQLSFVSSSTPNEASNGTTSTSLSFMTEERKEKNEEEEEEEETLIITKIQTILNDVFKEIKPHQVRFFNFREKTREVDKLKLYLSEKLLQGLLKLDALSFQAGWMKAREQRKSSVKEIQALLDSIDEKYNSLVSTHH
ncbi:hypothetical protein HMI55_005903 [Coelomomyces lativittatus]|nr:hypothetical protein HMI55_005903 [Coelomomyces lativittatus]KAJ1515255.1 hypothetical protein HMI56_006192 [Coelomomyces lativittatus]